MPKDTDGERIYVDEISGRISTPRRSFEDAVCDADVMLTRLLEPNTVLLDRLSDVGRSYIGPGVSTLDVRRSCSQEI